MRLEFLFEQFSNAAAGQSQWDARSALHRLLEIINLVGRSELRAELLKELERHATALNRLRQAPGVDGGALATILAELGQTMSEVHGLDNLTLDQVRQNDFLNAIRQRSNIPGGTCSFDLPALYHWLQHGPEQRARYLADWIRPFAPMREALSLVLRLIRGSAMPRREVAEQGFFQKALDSNAPNQIVRVFVPLDLEVYPEISGGKHRFSIRFMVQPDPNTRAIKTDEDVPFSLVCCVM